MHKRIRDERGIQPCYRDDVHRAMQLLDANGLMRRKPGKCRIDRIRYSSRGPNDTWHIDGNDKLKFYGVWIHLAIDGYSRRLSWLHAATSNQKPKFIARFFVDAVNREGGCPRLVRADRGTENSYVAVIQTSFRSRCDDRLAGLHSLRYGKSVHNQRAESFYSFLKKSWIQIWQERFESMVAVDILDLSNPIHTHCLQYSFLRLIQNELNLERVEWNQHNIRKQRGLAGPFGKPDVLFYSPQQGATDLLCPVDVDLIQYSETLCCEQHVPLEIANASFRKLCHSNLQNTSFKSCIDVKEATASYIHLTSHFISAARRLSAVMPRSFEEACTFYNVII